MMDLTREAREIRNAYFRDWHKRNPEKSKTYQLRYWQKLAEEMEDQQAGQK